MNKNILILLLIVLTINQKTVMAESSRDNNKSTIVRTVIREILLSLPSSIDRICIVEKDVSYNKLLGYSKVLDLKDLDNRIVTDDSTCAQQQLNDQKSNEVIRYFDNLGPMIKEMTRPSDKQAEEVYDKMIKHLKEEDLLVGAAFEKCGADETFYAFRIGKNGPQLVDSAVFGSVKCVTRVDAALCGEVRCQPQIRPSR